MVSDLEKAQIMYKLARAGKWGACYDRTEYFKRFQNLNETIKELSKIKWLIIYNKGRFMGISLNSQYKREIVDFIVKQMPYTEGNIK